jgi:hypothetical protein
MRGTAAAMTGASARALATQSTLARSSMRVSQHPPACRRPPAVSYLSQRRGPSAFAAEIACAPRSGHERPPLQQRLSVNRNCCVKA